MDRSEPNAVTMLGRFDARADVAVRCEPVRTVLGLGWFSSVVDGEGDTDDQREITNHVAPHGEMWQRTHEIGNPGPSAKAGRCCHVPLT